MRVGEDMEKTYLVSPDKDLNPLADKFEAYILALVNGR
jgi:hypothetical protein